MNFRRAFSTLFAIAGLSGAVTSLSHAQLLPPLPGGNLVVSITAPSDNATVSGATTVNASVTVVGSLTVAGVQFKLDGANLGAEDSTPPYSISWNTVGAINGRHTLTAVARDLLGLSYASNPVTVTVFNDKTPPSVSITAPASGATVSGTIKVSANATDNVGVAGVRFRVDGLDLGGEDTAAPYSASWNTLTASNGSHKLTATARDAAGNTATSAVTVTVFNDTSPPSITITSPASGATVSGSIRIVADATDNVAVAGVRFMVDDVNIGEDSSAPYAINWNTSAVADGSHALTAIARDTAGNQQASAPVTIQILNATPADTTAPTVKLNTPADGTTVSGTIMIGADASDDVGIADVQFRADGGDLGQSDSTAPYAISWDTTRVADGAHTLTAIARDTSGNIGNAPAVTVTVANSQSTVSRFEESFATYAGAGWRRRGAEVGIFSGGGAAASNVPGNSASLRFTGTGIALLGLKCNICGIAQVSIDDAAPVALDTAGPAAPGSTGLASEILFNAGGLSAGTHSLTISVSADTSTSDTFVVIDAFDITGGGPLATRIEDSDQAVSFTPESAWVYLDDARATNASAVESKLAGARSSVTFTGTAIRWLGYHFDGGGIARVYIDGIFVGEVDQYYPVEILQGETFSASGLAPGTHTLTIEVTGSKRPESNNTWVLIDAFDVVP